MGETTGEQFLHYQNSGNTVQKITATAQDSSRHTTMARIKLLTLSRSLCTLTTALTIVLQLFIITQLKFALVTYILM